MRTPQNYLLALTASLLVLGTACTNNEVITETDTNTGKQITLYATHAAQGAQSRMSHEYISGDNKVEVKWTDGDAFRFFAGTATGVDFATTDDDIDKPERKSATFTSTGTVLAASSYQAFYPVHRAGTTWANCVFSVLGQVQTGDNDTDHLPDYNYMTLSSATTDLTNPLTFKHRIAILRFEVTLPSLDDGVKPTSLTLSTPEVAGLTVVQNASGLSVPDGGTSKQLTLVLENVTPVGNKFTAYLAVLPSTLSQKLACAVALSDNTIYNYTVAIVGNPTYDAGNVYNTATELDFTKEDDPAYNDVITFTGSEKPAGEEFSRLLEKSGENTSNWGASESDPYLITTAEQLKYLVVQINGSTTNERWTGKYFKLTKDVKVTAPTWTAIGISIRVAPPNNNYSFRGHFDGAGHVISGTLSTTVNDMVYHGVFGNIENGTVKNLHVKANVVRTSTKYCTLGGVAGRIAGESKIINCTMSGNVTGEGGDGQYSMAAGGIAGMVIDTFAEVIFCSNSGTVNLTGGATNTLIRTGGIIGLCSGFVSYCVNRGDVSSTTTGSGASAGARAGGITGVDGDISYCQNFGTISAASTTTSIAAAGGVSGGISDFGLTIHTSYNGSTSIIATGTNKYAGLLLGYGTSSDVYNCCTSVSEAGMYLIGGTDSNPPTNTLSNCTTIVH